MEISPPLARYSIHSRLMHQAIVSRLRTVAFHRSGWIPWLWGYWRASHYPICPGISRNLLATEIERTNLDQYSLRIDHQATANDNVFGRLSIFDARAFQPFGSGKLFESLLPGFGRDLTTKSYNLALSHTHTFTPDILNEFRFGYLNVSGGQISENRGVDFASSVGLLGTTNVAEDHGISPR